MTTTDPTPEDLQAGFSSPPTDSRPMMRWWWFGPSVSQQELDRELQAMASAGIGGVEVAYVYPLTASSPEFLSGEFLDHLAYAAERAGQLGLRFDLTLGSGWSFGGPHIETDLAATELHWERREITPAGHTIPVTGSWPGDRLVAAYLASGGAGDGPADYAEFPIVDNQLRIPADSGPREVLLAYARPTGQVVKRAAAGADGPVLDHYSATAATTHIEQVAEPLLQAVGPERVGSLFCDSLEVYRANWTPNLPEEFERRRGYPLRPYLYQLVVAEDGSDHLRADYYRTLIELYEENFVSVFQQWAAGQGVPFRIQGYGTPPATVSSFRFADKYEGEGWGWKEITQSRWASSAAHLYNQPVVSAESWTWVHSPSFRATPLDLKGEAHELLLSGINQFVGHGWPYSPTDVQGLGWFFYAAGALDDRNPWWAAMPGLMRYLQRLCWLMRQGRPVADVVIYVPYADIAPRLGREAGGSLDLWKETLSYVDPSICATIREGGWDFDLVDDTALTQIDPTTTPVLILPHVSRLPEPTRARLRQYTRAGGSILSIGGAGPEFDNQDKITIDDLGPALAGIIRPDLSITPASTDVGSVHRRCRDGDIHLVINTGQEARHVDAFPRSSRPYCELWDPATGQVESSGPFTGSASLRLEPYAARVLLLTDQPAEPAGTALGAELQNRQLDGDWMVQFADEDSPTSRQLPHRWEDDPGRAGFSGTATYRVDIDIGADSSTVMPKQTILDLGELSVSDTRSLQSPGPRSYRVAADPPVGDVAEVVINDEHCGTLWAPPYRINISDHLQTGRNRIELRVSNTAANAVSGDDAISARVADSRQHYGHRFAMQDLDRATEGLSSGLLQVPTLRWYRKDRWSSATTPHQ